MKRNREQIRVYILIIDIIGIILSFFLAAYIRYGNFLSPWFEKVYGIIFIFLVMGYICIYTLFDSHTSFFKRGFYAEMVSVIKSNLMLLLMITAILFIYQKGAVYSRLFIAFFFLYNIIITYLLRQYFKIALLSFYKKSQASNKVLIITTYDQAEEILLRIRKERMWEYQVNGFAIMDQDVVGKRIVDVPVKANRENLFDVVTREVVDEVFISIPYDKNHSLEELILRFENIGITVNLSITNYELNIKEKTVKNFGGYHVLTFSTRVYNLGSMAVKRMMDIVGALIGLAITGVLMLIIAPMIRIESRGPIIFSQIRIGRSGRRFQLYKFRSMYPDAEERKKELMEQNEMEGLMFKLSNDPRITKVGQFLRKTSLDELPQFLNILKGDMSLVGTRPPTEDEFLQYEGRHKRRLTLRPGLTGLWQTSGRSEIGDFEDVVKMDLDYIDNWSLLLDIKLLIKTLVVVVFRIGAK